MPSIANFLKPSPRLVIVYLATLVNMVLAAFVTVTVIHSTSGSLQAQEDLGVFMLIVGGGSAIALACLITILVEALSKISAPNLTKQLMINQVIVLGALNCAAPLLWAFGLKWLIRG